jgi:hypothetical protein
LGDRWATGSSRTIISIELLLDWIHWKRSLRPIEGNINHLLQ